MKLSYDCTFEVLPIEKITLDIQNPRIAKWIEIYGENPSAEQIALALGAGSGHNVDGGTSFNSLKQSILTNKGIIHPIIVNRTESDKLVVIEGNTRLQIYRDFFDQKVEGDWCCIPSMVYNNLSESTIDAIRLQAHLVGVREWDAYSKAKYLNHLRNQENLTLSQIVDYCGGDKRKTINSINAFNDMEKHYTQVIESDQDFDATRFSAFLELQSPRITEAITMAGYTKTDFARWVHNRKIYPLNTVRKLPLILQSKVSRETFFKSNASDAIARLNIPSAKTSLENATIYELSKELCKKINSVPYEELLELKNNPNEEQVEILSELRSTISLFIEDIDTVNI